MSRSAPSLPGFYFDSVKNRYFSISSKPAGREQTARSGEADIVAPVYQNPGHYNETIPTARRGLRTLLPLADIETIAHSLRCQTLSSSRFAESGRLRLQTSAYRGEATVLTIAPHCHLAGTSEGNIFRKFCLDSQTLAGEQLEELGWLWERSLQTRVTNITVVHDRYFATSLGPDPLILVSRVEGDSAVQELEVRNFVQEVWTASITADGVALGCNGRALYGRSVEDMTRGMTYVKTKGDVFALHQRENELLIGTRSGIVRLFDVRLPPTTAREILHATSAVTNIHVYQDFNLLVCAMDGASHIFDLRFLRSSTSPVPAKPAAVMTLQGHVNSYTQGLGFCISPANDVLFLAGQDRHIRGWSLRTSQPLFPTTESAPNNPLVRIFQNPIKAMALAETKNNLQLHAIDGNEVFTWMLGDG